MNAQTSSVPQTNWKELLTTDRKIELTRIVGTAVAVFLVWLEILPIYVLWAAVVVGLYPLVVTGIGDLVRERKVGTEIFVTAATLVAVLGGEAIAGAVLLIIILIAEFIAEFNTDRARASIRNLIGSVPQSAIVRREGSEVRVFVDQIGLGDVVVVRAGDKVTVDGRIITGGGSLNEAPITGESVPRDKMQGDEVFAGTILESGAIDVQTTRVGADTTFAQIVKLVEDAEASQAPVQKLADKVAAWLIPIVVVFLIAVFLITRDIRTIVTLLIFTSPAELGLATPMVVIAAIARAARNGILIKGGVHLESLAKIDTIAFDKTGTLTVGKPQVQAVSLFEPTMDEQRLLQIAAAADRRSAHPLALAVVNYAAAKNISVPQPESFDSVAGKGVRAVVDGAEVLVGNAALLAEIGVAPPAEALREGFTAVFVTVDRNLKGAVYLADEIRASTPAAIERLRGSGIEHIAMLTGDNNSTAKVVAGRTGIDEVFAELLPAQKVDAIRELQQSGRSVAMVGDGVNDAPALAAANLGIAMGVGGTQAALEAADIALMTDDLDKIVLGRIIAQRAYRTIKENLFVGVGVVHVLGITAALLGWIGPIQAAFLHLGPDVLVFLNSVKLLKIKVE